VKISIILYYYEKGFDYERLNFVKEDMADIPQSLYEAMKGILPACKVIPHLRCGHAVRLETWLPILQGIADKGFSGHPPCLCR